jgi:hypothetical protein
MHKICAAIVASTILIPPAFGHENRKRHDNDHGHNFHGAPGPIAGTGLPFLAVGYGVYGLVKRRRKAAAMHAETEERATDLTDGGPPLRTRLDRRTPGPSRPRILYALPWGHLVTGLRRRVVPAAAEVS